MTICVADTTRNRNRCAQITPEQARPQGNVPDNMEPTTQQEHKSMDMSKQHDWYTLIPERDRMVVDAAAKWLRPR
jgi:hypothetical protein